MQEMSPRISTYCGQTVSDTLSFVPPGNELIQYKFKYIYAGLLGVAPGGFTGPKELGGRREAEREGGGGNAKRREIGEERGV